MFRLRHQDLRDEIDMAAEALKRNPASPASVVPEVTLSRSEIRELESLAATLRNRPRAPRLKIKAERGKPLHIGVAAPIDAARLNAMFGTAESGFADLMLAGLLNAACDGGPSNPPSERSINQVLAAVTGVGARDEVEGMLATQMVATHFAAVTLLRRLKGAENIPQQDSAGGLAVKLLRSYTAQMEALQRYRGKGQQKLTVEHVHVHEGGQAIVGNVQGGGVPAKPEEQSHATALTFEPGQTLPSQIETLGETVPSARG